MRALPSDRWRAFVEFYVAETFRNDHKNNHGAQTYAARAAGFGRPNSTPRSMASIAWNLMRDERIIAAVAEESRQMRRAASPEVVRAWLGVLRDPDHPGHIRAIQMGMDRDEPVTTHQSIDVTHRHIDPVAEEIAELRALRELGTSREKLVELFGSNGLLRLEKLEAADAAQNAKVIQGEVIDTQEEGNGQTKAG